MRTKTLLLAAAFSAATILTSNAQVYSVNAVGYVNVTVNLGSGATTPSLMANPLNGSPDNTIGSVLPSVPDFTLLYTFENGGFVGPATFLFGAWDDPTVTVAPGQGFFLILDNNFASDPTIITFVGEVPQGTLTTPVPDGVSLLASQVPQSGGLTTDLGFPAANLDLVYLWDNDAHAYSGGFTFFDFGGGATAWDPSEPTLNPADAFVLITTGGARDWTRTFSVNP